MKNLSYSPGWPQTPDSLASASQVLELQRCSITLRLEIFILNIISSGRNKWINLLILTFTGSAPLPGLHTLDTEATNVNSQLHYSQAGSEARRALGFPLEPAHAVSHQERQRQVGSLNVLPIYAPEIVKAFSGPEKTFMLGCALGFPSSRLYQQWAEKRICNSSHSQNAGKAVSAGTQHVIPADSSLLRDHFQLPKSLRCKLQDTYHPMYPESTVITQGSFVLNISQEKKLSPT